KRDSDCSRTSSSRSPRSSETASFARRILPWRSETKTGSGALAMIRFASRSFIVQLLQGLGEHVRGSKHGAIDYRTLTAPCARARPGIELQPPDPTPLHSWRPR